MGTMAENEVVRIKEVSGLPVAALRGTQYSLLRLIHSYFISAHGRAFSFSHPRRSTGQEFSASSSTERSREIKELPKVSHYILLEQKGELSSPSLGFWIYASDLLCRAGDGIRKFPGLDWGGRVPWEVSATTRNHLNTVSRRVTAPMCSRESWRPMPVCWWRRQSSFPSSMCDR